MTPGAPRWRFGSPVAPLAEILDRGGVLAVPTESSYGLATDPWSTEGIGTIFRLKGREAGKALPLVAADLDQIAALSAEPDGPGMERLRRVESRIWPGPLSVVLPAAAGLPSAAPDGTVAVRIPGHAGLRLLLAELGRPLTATSANRSGEPPVLTPEAAARLLAGADAAVLDGDRLPGGPPSTVVRFRDGGIEVLREGAVSGHEARRLLTE